MGEVAGDIEFDFVGSLLSIVLKRRLDALCLSAQANGLLRLVGSLLIEHL